MLKTKKRLLINLGLTLTMLCASICGLLFNLNINTAETTDYSLTIQKVSHLVDSLDTQSYIDIDDVKIVDISNNDFVILNNANLEEREYEGTTYFIKERVLINFQAKANTTLTMLESTATLNGVSIDTGEVITETDGTTSTKSFTQHLDLGPLNYLIGDPIENREGLYTYTFVYRVESNGVIGAEKRVVFNFYLLDESTYLNPVVETLNANPRDNTLEKFNNLTTTNNQHTEPRLSFTERIDRSYYSSVSSEVNYFNYTNQKNTVYDGSEYDTESSNVLNYPTLTFDASKFNLSYTKALYGVSTTVTSSFSVVAGVGKLILTSTTSGVATTSTIDINPQLDGSYIVSLNFENIGDYIFSFKLMLKIGSNYLVVTTNQVKTEQWKLIGDVKLYNYGYQLFNSVYGSTTTTEAEFKNASQEMFTDVTILNDTGVTLNTLTGNLNLPVGSTTADMLLFTYEDLCYTNQAPVYLKYYALLKYAQSGGVIGSFYNYYKNYESYETYVKYLNGEVTLTESEIAECSPTKYNLANSTRFTQNGYYQVFIYYTFEKYQYVDNENHLQDANYAAQLKEQTFAFAIANYEPTVVLEKVDSLGEHTPFYVGEFTNQNVELSWNTSNTFEVLPQVSIYVQAFTSTTYTDITSSANYLSSNSVLFSSNGRYKVVIKYGPGYATSVTYRFTIDKDSISTVNFYNVENNEVGSQTANNISSSNFMAYWTGKASGAEIYATYSFIPLTNTYSISTSPILSGTKTILENGYEISTVNAGLNYEKSSTNEGSLSSATDLNSVLKNAGVYVFTFTDDAGNTLTKAMFLEKSNSTMLINEDGSSTIASLINSTLVSGDAELVWGSHKGIEVSSEVYSLISNSELLFSSYLVDNSGNYYFAIPLNQVSISYKDSNAQIQTQIINVGSSGSYTTGQNLIAFGNSAWNYGEKTYDINISDSVNFSTHYEVEMNLDHSLVMAYTTGAYTTSTGTDTSSYQRLQINNVTNRQVLRFDWLSNSGTDYELESLTYSFYPLSFDSTSENYPYSSTPSYENIDIINGATNSAYNDGKLMSSQINLVIDENYTDQVTMAGMYVLTRTYLNTIPENTGDTQTRNYYFYIDRTGIIEQINDVLVGENIMVTMGTANQKTFGGSQFLLDYPTSYLFDTNRFPIDVVVPTQKYSTSAQINSTNKLSITQISCQIKLGDMLIKDESQLVNSGIYSVNITDNTGYNYYTIDTNGTQVAHLNIDPISFNFSFKVSNEKPNGDYVKNGTDYLVSNSSSNSISVNTNSIKFVWSVPQDEYRAEIDENNLSIKKYDVSGNVTTILSIVNGVKNTAVGYSSLQVSLVSSKPWNYEIDLSGLPLESAKYSVTIQYKGSSTDYGTNYTNVETIYFDYIAPMYNYNNLLSADNYLSSAQKSIFDNYNSAVNFENYAFLIDENYAFTKNTDDSFWLPEHDSAFVYFRKYDKYNTSVNINDAYLNEQSLIPEDSRYSNYTLEPTRLRFNSQLKIGGAFVYQTFNYTTSFYSQMYSLYGENCYGYYEIIEIDDAGNHRIYSVELKNPVDNLEIAYSINDSNGELIEQSNMVFSSTNREYSINNSLLVLNDLINQSAWLNVTVINMTSLSSTSLILSPFDDLYYSKEELLSAINDLITPQNSTAGNYFKIEILTNSYSLLTIHYRSPGAELELLFTDSSQSFTVTLPSTTSTYITNFKVYKAINGVYYETLDYQVLTDSHSVAISENPVYGTVYTYYFSLSGGSGGDYWFIYTDNFNRETKVEHIIGLTDAKSILFSGTSVKVDEINYTAEQTYILYQPALYQLTINKTINGITDAVNISNLISVTNADGTIRLTLFTQMPSNSRIDYEIIFTNSANRPFTTQVAFYSMLSTITFKDSSDEVQSSLGNDGVTTKFIYIYYNSTETIIPTYVSGMFESADGLTTNLGNVVNGQSFTGYGKYTLQVYNALGVRKTFTFNIKQNVALYYAVIAQINGVNTETLSPSSVKYTYNGQQIDSYYTIYNYVVELNSAKKLVSTPTIINANTTVYTITSTDSNLSTYQKVFAVTKVASSTNFLGLNFKTNSTTQTGSSVKYATSTVTVSMPLFNTYDGNLIYVEYYYNSIYMGKITLTELSSGFGFVLSDSGVYDIYVKDLAGNTAKFNTYSYFRIYLLNQILFTLNDASSLNNSVFNGDVALSLQQLTQYDSPKITVNALKNGATYTPNKENGVYYFTEYGIYQVSLEGSVQSQIVSTTIIFTIVNPNEARIAYEYNGSNNYEVTLIKRDGIDITDEIKTALGINNINKFALSSATGGLGGNGIYTITVTTHFNSKRPDQSFTFTVWINNQTTVILQTSIDYGETTTNNILVAFNKYQIYSKLGECTIKINGNDWITIDASTSNENIISYYELAENGVYNVTLVTSSGNTISSFVVTIVEPLNTVAIIVIIIASLAVVGLTVLFIVLRRNMRVK